MLEGLDSVRWKDLHHAYGPATDVPGLLRAIAGSDEAGRNEAWSALHGNVLHQGTVWQATPHVVPFLVELLAADIPERERLVTYLGLLASEGSGGVAVEVPSTTDMDEEEREMRVRHGSAGRDTRAAVLRGLEVYGKEVEHHVVAVRVAGCFLLGKLGPAAATVARWVEPLLHDADDRVAASAVLALGDLAVAAPALRASLDPTVRDPRPLVRLATAIALAHAGETATAEVVETISAVLRDPTPVAAGYAELPWRWLNVETDLARLAGTLEVDAGAGLVQPLLDLLDRRKDPITSGMVLTTILRFLFGPVDWEGFRATPRRRRSASALAPEQRRALEALLHKDIWEHRSGGRVWGNGNLGAALNPQQLPTDRAELAAFLGLGT